MTLWLLAGLVCLLAALLLLRPLVTRTPGRIAGDDRARRIYRDQLAELERDHAAGLISGLDHDAARLEIERRILATGDEPPARARRGLRLAAVVMVLLVPAASLLLYGGYFGSPDRVDDQGVEHRGAPERSLADLEARTRVAPEDAEAWIALGHAALAAGMPERAVTALRRAESLLPEDPAVLSALGVALVNMEGGRVGDTSESLFRRLLALNPLDPVARFHLGLAAYQREDREEALRIWRALAADTSADAPWRSELDERISIASREQVDGVHERVVAMVEGLADRLEQEPDDPDGWARLGRSYLVLGRREEGLAAYAKASELAPDRIDILSARVRALHPLETPDAAVPAELRPLVDRLLELDPGLPLALWYAGMIARTDGETGQARQYWSRLLETMPPDEPAREVLQREIGKLGGE